MKTGAHDVPVVAGLGHVEVSVTGMVARMPETRFPAEVDQITIQLAGSGAVSIGTAAAMGCRTRFGCRIADEFIGRYIVAAMADAGIEPMAAMDSDAQLSGLRFTALEAERNRRMSFFTRGDAEPPSAADFDIQALVKDCNAVLLDGTLPMVQLAVAEAARAAGAMVILDGSRAAPGMSELVSAADVFVSSERLAVDLVPASNLEQSIAGLQNLGPRTSVITLGRGGCIGAREDELVRQSAFNVNVVDPVGAGAVFHGALAAALIDGMPFAKCLQFASAAASLSCAAVGTWSGIPTRQAVIELLDRASVLVPA